MAFSIYSDIDNSSLYQGDLIVCSDDLYSIICEESNICRRFKPHYLAVLTQSCDLRKYKSKWKSESVTISFVYKFKEHATRLIDGLRIDKIDDYLLQDNLISKENEARILKNLSDIIQYKSHECFLYHNDITFNIEDNYYINLRVSIPLQIDSVHEIFLKNKIAQLKENFRDKLGYNISYLFSRVGVDEPDSKFVERINSSLLSGYNIVPTEKVSEIRKKQPQHLTRLESIQNTQERIDYINEIPVATNNEIIERVLLKHIAEKSSLTDGECNSFVKSFLNNSEVRSILKNKT